MSTTVELETLEGTTLSTEGARLVEYSDSFGGDILNADRWHFGYCGKYRLENTTPFDSSFYTGTSTYQDEGLHFGYPRGYCNRQIYAEGWEPLQEYFGVRGECLGVFFHNRAKLEGDFDVTVDFENFTQMGGRARIGVILTNLSPTLYPNGALLYRQNDDKVYCRFPPSYTTPTATSTGSSGRFRLVRSGSTLTCYHWSAGAWASVHSTATFTTTPISIQLFMEAALNTHLSGSFKDFSVNSATYPTQGQLTTPVYDAQRDVTWETVSWTEDLPTGTDIALQLAVSDDVQGPWNFVGPDGTGATYFSSASGQAVLAATTGRYAQVRAYLSGNGSATPTLESLAVGYSGQLDSQSRVYSYDLAGNLEKILTRGSSSLEETRQYNAMNEMTQNVINDGVTPVTWTFTHDNNGNLTSKSDGTDTWDYAWDEENRMISVSLNTVPVVEYKYDSSSRLLQRVEGATTTNYIWDGWDLVREEKSGAVTETTDYLCPEGEVLAFKRGGDWYYLHGDALSSTQLVTDESGAVVGRYVYGAWGEELVASESIPGLFENRFVGGLGCRRDSATGLVYMRHRWYDCQLQRFISRDPIGFAGGTNLYAYAENSPLNFVDPEGLEILPPSVVSGTATNLTTAMFGEAVASGTGAAASRAAASRGIGGRIFGAFGGALGAASLLSTPVGDGTLTPKDRRRLREKAFKDVPDSGGSGDCPDRDREEKCREAIDALLVKTILRIEPARRQMWGLYLEGWYWRCVNGEIDPGDIGRSVSPN